MTQTKFTKPKSAIEEAMFLTKRDGVRHSITDEGDFMLVIPTAKVKNKDKILETMYPTP